MSHFVAPLNNRTVADLMVTANSYSSGWFGYGILLSIFFIAFFSLKNFFPDRAFAAASFLTTISAIFLRIMNVIGDQEVYIAILAGIGGIIWLYIAERFG